MITGCKVILITNKEDITTDFIVKALTLKNSPFYRFNTDELGETVFINFDFQQSIFEIIDARQGLIINLLEVRVVYFRRPEIRINKEGLTAGEVNFIRSEIAYMLEGLYRILDQATWVNDVWAIRSAENKIYQLLLAGQVGFKVPESLISNIPMKLSSFMPKQKEILLLNLSNLV